jgi:ArsR family transcriptional regulator
LAKYAIKDKDMQTTLSITNALADSSRLRVFTALTTHDELCVCQVTKMLKLAPATVSRHMSILQNAKLVQSRKEGRWVYYRLSATVSPLLLAWLAQALATAQEIRLDDHLLAVTADTVPAATGKAVDPLPCPCKTGTVQVSKPTSKKGTRP